MPTYPKIYVAIPRIGSGLDADNALRPDFIGRDGAWPRHSKVTDVFRQHPTHTISRITISEQGVLDDLRSRPGVLYLGITIEEARRTIENSSSRIASDGRRALQETFDKRYAWASRYGPSSYDLIHESVVGPTSYTDADVTNMLAQRPADYTPKQWRKYVSMHFKVRPVDIVRLLQGGSDIGTEPFDFTNAAWDNAGNLNWNFYFETGTGVTHTQGSGNGVLTRGASNAVLIDTIDGIDIDDSEGFCEYLTADAAVRPGLSARFVLADVDYYMCQFVNPETSGADLHVYTIDNNVFNQFATDNNIGPIQNGRIRMRVEGGTSPLVNVRIWDVANAEPGAWNITDANPTALDNVTGSVGLRTNVSVSNTGSLSYADA
ncbi:MAG: hypothetical protein IIC82_06085, partial [Chloroflexi bacterium]|nr:hypothetical protein [Chloroflexota bacterium]